jgi:hydroxymethylpyrimidine/phosphomethylpyrimidine kinase
MCNFNGVPSWTSSDGEIHTDYVKYLRHELFVWFKLATDNAPAARTIVDKLDERALSEMIVMLQTLNNELQSPSVFTVVRQEAPKNPAQLALAAA